MINRSRLLKLALPLLALPGCEAVVVEAMAPALPALIPLAILAENADDPDRTVQPVRVEASGRVLAAHSGEREVERTFNVTRLTITCAATQPVDGVHTGKEKAVTCTDGRTGTFRNGDPLTRYNPARLRLGKDENELRCSGAYEGNLEKATASPFIVECGEEGGEAAIVAWAEGDTINYRFWINMP